jgi:hypothetical protein
LIARLGESDDFELHRAFLPSKPRRGKAPITHARPPATSWNPQIAQIFTDSRRGAQATTTVILSGAPKEGGGGAKSKNPVELPVVSARSSHMTELIRR